MAAWSHDGWLSEAKRAAQNLPGLLLSGWRVGVQGDGLHSSFHVSLSVSPGCFGCLSHRRRDQVCVGHPRSLLAAGADQADWVLWRNWNCAPPTPAAGGYPWASQLRNEFIR